MFYKSGPNSVRFADHATGGVETDGPDSIAGDHDLGEASLDCNG